MKWLAAIKNKLFKQSVPVTVEDGRIIFHQDVEFVFKGSFKILGDDNVVINSGLWTGHEKGVIYLNSNGHIENSEVNDDLNRVIEDDHCSCGHDGVECDNGECGCKTS